MVSGEQPNFPPLHLENIHLEKSNPFADIKADTVISSGCLSIYFAANRFNLPTAELSLELPVFLPCYVAFRRAAM